MRLPEDPVPPGQEPPDQEAVPPLRLLPVQRLACAQRVERREDEHLPGPRQGVGASPTALGPGQRREDRAQPAGLLPGLRSLVRRGQAEAGVKMSGDQDLRAAQHPGRGPRVTMEVSHPVAQETVGGMERHPAGERACDPDVVVPQDELDLEPTIRQPSEELGELRPDVAGDPADRVLHVSQEKGPTCAHPRTRVEQALGEGPGRAGLRARSARRGQCEAHVDIGGDDHRERSPDTEDPRAPDRLKRGDGPASWPRLLVHVSHPWNEGSADKKVVRRGDRFGGSAWRESAVPTERVVAPSPPLRSTPSPTLLLAFPLRGGGGS